MPAEKDPQTPWGWFIRGQREARNWSQTELAERLDVAKSTVMDMEIGPKRKRDVELLLKIQKLFDVPFVTIVEAAGYDSSELTVIDRDDLSPFLQQLVTEAEALPEEERKRLLDFAQDARRRHGQGPRP